MDIEIGQLLDNKYKIVRIIGEGGMGAVYEGENVRIHHRVAIKVLHPNIAADTGARERFEREAQAAGRIGSDHIVEVFDLGELPSGARYMVMEFLAGEPLSQRIQTLGRMTPEQVAPLMLQLLEGLGAAHDAGIVHRDLKPENVFLQRAKGGHDFVKIVDFGVSKFGQLSGGSSSGMSMTRTGAVVGTPYYMSPEQVKGQKNVDHRSDLYSAGIVLFEAVTGRLPFEAETFNELIFRIALEPPLDPQVAVPGLDPEFAKIVRKSAAREVGDRYQTAPEFAAAIAGWMQYANVTSPSVQIGSSVMTAFPRPPSTSSPYNTPGPQNHTPNPQNYSNVPHGSQPGATHTPNPQNFSGTPNPQQPVQAATMALEKTTASGSVLNQSASATRKKSGGGIAAVAAVAVVVVAAAGFGVLKMRGSAAPQAPQAAAMAAPQVAPAPAASAEVAAAPAPSPAPAPEPAASAQLAPEPSASDEPRPRPANTAAPRPVAPAQAPAHHAPAVAAAPVAAAPAAPAASTPSSETTIKGRTVRTEL